MKKLNRPDGDHIPKKKRILNRLRERSTLDYSYTKNRYHSEISIKQNNDHRMTLNSNEMFVYAIQTIPRNTIKDVKHLLDLMI